MTVAVAFDLDGVLVDSEPVWDAARRRVADQHGGHWTEAATTDMIGMSSPEWSRYLRDRLGVALAPAAISAEVVRLVSSSYARQLPVLPHADSTVRALSRVYPLALASSSNRAIIELVLDRAGIRDAFLATVSSEEVARGKPAPDVYLEVARRLKVEARRCVAVEDSTNGILAAVAAEMHTVAVPNPHAPPSEPALSSAERVLRSLSELTVELVETLA